MVIHKRSLFLVSFILASASLSLAYSSSRDPIRQLEQCLEPCQNARHMLQCEGRCAHEYYTQRRHEFEEDELVDVSPQREFQQCQQRCKRKESGQRRCLDSCERRFQERQDEEFGEDVNRQTPPRRCQQECQWEPRQHREQCLRQCERKTEAIEFGEDVNRQDPSRKCQQQCAEVATGRGQQEQCQRRCVSCQQRCLDREHHDQQQCSTMCRREMEREFGSEDDVNRQDPSRKCQQQCSEVATGRGQQEQCQRRCVSCQRQCQDREQHDQQQCSTICRREVEREFGSEDVNREDTPRRCRQECQGEPRRQQGQCLRRCKREMEEERFDPEEELEECKSRCQRQVRGYQQQMQCQKRCERETEFQPQRPSQSYGSCRRRCQEQQASQPRRLRQCMERCDQEFRGRETSQPLASILDFMGIF